MACCPPEALSSAVEHAWRCADDTAACDRLFRLLGRADATRRGAAAAHPVDDQGWNAIRAGYLATLVHDDDDDDGIQIQTKVGADEASNGQGGRDDSVSSSPDVDAFMGAGRRARSVTAMQIERIREEKMREDALTKVPFAAGERGNPGGVFDALPVAVARRGRTSLATELVLHAPKAAVNPFQCYAPLAAPESTAASKRFIIYCPGADEPGVSVVVSLSASRRVVDLVKLACYEYTEAGFKPALNTDTSVYSMYMAEMDGEIEYDLPPLSSGESIGRIDFPVLALVASAQKKSRMYSSATSDVQQADGDIVIVWFTTGERFEMSSRMDGEAIDVCTLIKHALVLRRRRRSMQRASADNAGISTDECRYVCEPLKPPASAAGRAMEQAVAFGDDKLVVDLPTNEVLLYRANSSRAEFDQWHATLPLNPFGTNYNLVRPPSDLTVPTVAGAPNESHSRTVDFFEWAEADAAQCAAVQRAQSIDDTAETAGTQSRLLEVGGTVGRYRGKAKRQAAVYLSVDQSDALALQSSASGGNMALAPSMVTPFSSGALSASRSPAGSVHWPTPAPSSCFDFPAVTPINREHMSLGKTDSLPFDYPVQLVHKVKSNTDAKLVISQQLVEVQVVQRKRFFASIFGEKITLDVKHIGGLLRLPSKHSGSLPFRIYYRRSPPSAGVYGTLMRHQSSTSRTASSSMSDGSDKNVEANPTGGRDSPMSTLPRSAASRIRRSVSSANDGGFGHLALQCASERIMAEVQSHLASVLASRGDEVVMADFESVRAMLSRRVERTFNRQVSLASVFGTAAAASRGAHDGAGN